MIDGYEAAYPPPTNWNNVTLSPSSSLVVMGTLESLTATKTISSPGTPVFNYLQRNPKILVSWAEDGYRCVRLLQYLAFALTYKLPGFLIVEYRHGFHVDNTVPVQQPIRECIRIVRLGDGNTGKPDQVMPASNQPNVAQFSGVILWAHC